MEPVNCTASELSTYLRALEAGFLPTFYSDTSQFALSSSIRIASKSWRSGKRMGCFPGFPSLPMSASSTAGPGADSLMSLPADSHARTSVSQAKAQESTAIDPAYGVKWRGSLARFDPGSRSWKTAQHSLIEDSDECSVTWPRSGMTVGGQCYLLPTLERRTGASESGSLLPTPCTVDTGSMFNRSASSGAALRPTLGAMARFDLWPTPTSSLGTKGGQVTPRKSREGGTLIEAVSNQTQWPTPTVSGNNNVAGRWAKSGDGLRTAVMWRTPGAYVIDAKSTVVKLTGRKPSDPQVGLADQVKAADPKHGGSLSPDWVELLMGWPKGWTSLEPLESSEIRGWGEGWEDDTARVLAGVTNRVQRLKAIGNGQVPKCAATAWGMLT